MDPLEITIGDDRIERDVIMVSEAGV